jgi:uncharacterized membrane protein YdbT with pleckstrin-like domain
MKLEEEIRKGETILIKTKPHWAIFFPVFNGLLFATLIELIGPHVGLFNQIFGLNVPLYHWLALAIIFFALSNGLLILYHQQTAHYVLTNRRVIARFGTFYTVSYDMFLNRIESIEVRQTLMQRYLNCGHVILRGIGSTSPLLPYLPKPHAFREKILDHIG